MVAAAASGTGGFEAGLREAIEEVGGAKRKLKTDQETRLWFVCILIRYF